MYDRTGFGRYRLAGLAAARATRPDGPSTARTADRLPLVRPEVSFDGIVRSPAPGPAPGRWDYGATVLSDVEAMREALVEAARATEHGDVPVGAVVVMDGEIVARRHNEREGAGDPTAHAEILALRDAAARAGSWRLEGATMFVTLEPCPMCAGALVAARVGRLVFGAVDPKAGACGSLYNVCADPRLNHELPVTAGVLGAEASELLASFFNGLRERG